MEVASAGAGEDPIEPALHGWLSASGSGLFKLGKVTLCSLIMYVMYK